MHSRGRVGVYLGMEPLELNPKAPALPEQPPDSDTVVLRRLERPRIEGNVVEFERCTECRLIDRDSRLQCVIRPEIAGDVPLCVGSTRKENTGDQQDDSARRRHDRRINEAGARWA